MSDWFDDDDDHGWSSFNNSYIRDATEPEDPRIRRDQELRELVKQDTVTANQVYRLQFGGGLPLALSDIATFDPLHQPVPLAWKKLRGIDGRYVSEPGGGRIEINSAKFIRNGLPACPEKLVQALSEQMLWSMQERIGVIAPDAALPKTPREKIQGAELARLLVEFEREQQNLGLKSRWQLPWKKEDDFFPTRNWLLATMNHAIVTSTLPGSRVGQDMSNVYGAFVTGGVSIRNRQEALIFETGVGERPPKQSRLDQWLGQLSRETERSFWEQIVRVFYGDLLNLYGHVNGRAAMGVETPDPEGARNFYTRLRQSASGCPDHPIHPGEWKPLAADVHHDYAGQLAHHAKQNGNHAAWRALVCQHRDAVSAFEGASGSGHTFPGQDFPPMLRAGVRLNDHSRYPGGHIERRNIHEHWF